MARYIDVEGYRKLFDEEYKKTRELIYEGETHLDNLAEGFSEASRVIDRIPTADVVPKSEVEQLKQDVEIAKIAIDNRNVELEGMRTAANSYKMHYGNLAREIFEEIEKVACVYKLDGDFYIDNGLYAELKKKYTEKP